MHLNESVHNGYNYVVHVFHRILVERMQVYDSKRKFVQWHIPSKYSSEMSQKSDVVSDFSISTSGFACHGVAYIYIGASWCFTF